jgi:hypothetical protein
MSNDAHPHDDDHGTRHRQIAFMQDPKNLAVYQRSVDLAVSVYRLQSISRRMSDSD